MCPAEVREECTICLRLNFNWHLSYKQFLHICAVLSVVSPHTWFNTKYEIDMMIPILQEEETMAQRSKVLPGPCLPAAVHPWRQMKDTPQRLIQGLSSGASMAPALDMTLFLLPETLSNINFSAIFSELVLYFFRLNTKYHFPSSKLIPTYQNSGLKSPRLHQVKFLPVRFETWILLSHSLPCKWGLIGFLWPWNQQSIIC